MALLVRHLQRLYRNWPGIIKAPIFPVGCPVAYVQLYATCVSVRACLYVWMGACMFECMPVCVQACACLFVCVHVCVVMHMHVCVCDEYAHL